MKMLTKNTSQGEKKNKNRRAIWALAMGLFIVVVALFVVLPIVKSKSPKASHGLVAVHVQAGETTACVWARLDKNKKVKTWGGTDQAGESAIGGVSLLGKDVSTATGDIVVAFNGQGLLLDGATVTVFGVTGKTETEATLREDAFVGAGQAIATIGKTITVQKYKDANAQEEAKRLKITLGKYVIITQILQYDASKSVRTLATKGMDALIDQLEELKQS